MTRPLSVGVFTPTPEDNKEHHETLHWFFEGIRSVGVDHVFKQPLERGYAHCDIAVTFGVGKKAVPASQARGAVIKAHTSLDRPHVVVEKGFVRRDEYYMAGWNGLNGRADFNLGRLPWIEKDRWSLLGVELMPAAALQQDVIYNRNALVIGQVPWDASVQDLDHANWCVRACEMMKGNGWNVRFRPHPLAPNGAYPWSDIMHHISEPSAVTLEEDLAWSSQVVVQNSNTAVDAVVAGRSIHVSDAEGCMATACSSHLATLVNAYHPDPRPQWAQRLAWCQWNWLEMKAGDAWRHLCHDRLKEEAP